MVSSSSVSPKIGFEHPPNKYAPAPHMVILMKPLFLVGQIAGIFSLQINTNDPDNALYRQKYSFIYFRCIFQMILSSIYVIFHIFGITLSVTKGLSLVEIIGQSLWVQSAVISVVISISLLHCPHDYIQLFTKDWRAVEADCGKFFSSLKVHKFARNLILFYCLLGTISCMLVVHHALEMPLDPAYPLHYVAHYINTGNKNALQVDNRTSMVPGTKSNLSIPVSEYSFFMDGQGLHGFSKWIVILQGIGELWFMFWKWSGQALLDVTLCVFGNAVAQTMETTLNNVIEHNNRTKFAKYIVPSDTEQDHDGVDKRHIQDKVAQAQLQPSNNNASCVSSSKVCSKQKRSFGDKFTEKMTLGEDKVSNSGEGKHIYISSTLNASPANSFHGYHKDSYGGMVEQDKEWYKRNIFKVLDDYQKLGQLVTDVNNSLGSLLLINFAQLSFMICALIFLPIKYSQDFEWRQAILYSGNAIVFTARLVLLIICLGDVYPKAIEVNGRVAKFMIANSLSEDLMNPIMAHLAVFSANPVCFSAWGFFPITRGTLLGALSVISTYIVVLLQVK